MSEKNHPINPMGWARIPAEKSHFTGSTEFNQFELSLCARLSQIFVDQMGLARDIRLEIDANSGGKVLEFTIDKDSAIREQLSERQISGIPIRFSVLK